MQNVWFCARLCVGLSVCLCALVLAHLCLEMFSHPDDRKAVASLIPTTQSKVLTSRLISQDTAHVPSSPLNIVSNLLLLDLLLLLLLCLLKRHLRRVDTGHRSCAGCGDAA